MRHNAPTGEPGAARNPATIMEHPGARWTTPRCSPPVAAILVLVPFARAIDAEIHYEDSGGRGPVVLLGHEFFMDRTMFAPQVEALSPEFRIVAWDARGHGDTRDQGLPFTYWTSARDALAVLDQLGVERAVVGGTSQGGYSAIRTALLAPERVAALILIATEAHGPTAHELDNSRRFLQRWHEPRLRHVMSNQLAQWLVGDDAESRAVWVKRWVERDPRAIEVAAGCVLARDSILDRLHEITCPVLVIHPTGAGVARSHAVEMAQGLANSHFLEIPDARQAVNLTHPEQVNAAIGEFLREQLPTP